MSNYADKLKGLEQLGELPGGLGAFILYVVRL